MAISSWRTIKVVMIITFTYIVLGEYGEEFIKPIFFNRNHQQAHFAKSYYGPQINNGDHDFEQGNDVSR
jgi:hypothetical protein